MKIIPAIDIIDGKCVRLTQGDYAQKKIYNENPLEVAKQFEDVGITHLHLVDLDGAKNKHIVNYKVLEKISTSTSLHIDFGGGIKTDEDIRIAFNSGACQITAGSVAVNNVDIVLGWIERYGNQKIILGADVHNQCIAISGWQEKSAINLFDFLNAYIARSILYTICTDIAKDGMMEGPSYDLYKKIKSKFSNLNLIASGGVHNIEDCFKLAQIDLYGVIVGKAIYEGTLTLKEIAAFNQDML